jgi:hypothetical protein
MFISPFSPSRISPFGMKLVLIMISCVFLAATVCAQSKICVRKVSATPTPFNGVVAGGVATGGSCPIAPVWSLVTPAKFLPDVASPEAFLYLAHNPTINHLYIGVDLKGDADLSDQDVVAVVIDADNSSTFNLNDFSFKVKVSSLSPISTANPGGNPATDCTSATGTPATGTVDVLRHNGTEWVPLTTTAIKTSFAYDYLNDMADPEHDIWNLAIDITLGTDFILSPTGIFRVGSYIFMDTGHHTGTDPQLGSVLEWPAEMVDRAITDQNLFGIPETTAGQLAEANLSDSCFDVNFVTAVNPWQINGNVANSNDHRIIRNGLNTFKVTFYFDGPGDTTQPLSNTGTVRLSLTPYRASGSGTAWVQDLPVTTTNVNAEKSVDFLFNFASPPPSFGSTGDINFVCATMSLVGFQRDDNTSNNSNNVNYNYFVTSEYPAEFFIFGNGVPGLNPGESTTVFLRLDTNNDPQPARTGSGGTIVPSFNPSNKLILISWLVLLAISLSLLWYFTRKRPASGFGKYVAGVAVASLILISWQWACKGKSQVQSESGRWQIQNADELGLRPVKGERNLYEMPIKYEEAKVAKLRFVGLPLPYKTERHQFDPRGPNGDHNTLRIPARAGQVVTVVAFGEIDLDGPGLPLAPTSPTGRSLSQSTPSPDRVNAVTPQSRPPWLLSRGYYTPEEYAGALIGSFDNFETSFVVGRSASFIVPAEAGALSLAVNATRGAFDRITGSFDLFTIVTQAPLTPTHTVIQGDGTFHPPRRIELWEHLTGLNVSTYYPTVRRRDNGTILSQTLNPWGSAHFTVFDSHVGR